MHRLKIFSKEAQKDDFERGVVDGKRNLFSMNLEFTGETFLEALRKAKNTLNRFDGSDYYFSPEDGVYGSFSAYEDNFGGTIEGKKSDYENGDVWIVVYFFSATVVSPFKIPQSE